MLIFRYYIIFCCLIINLNFDKGKGKINNSNILSFENEFNRNDNSLTVKKVQKSSKKILRRRLDTINFEANTECLPWPLKNGIVYNYFGVHPHPVLNGIFVDNGGIEIISSDNSFARSVFRGVIDKIIAIPGGNQAIIISHGNYFTVYANLSSIFVKVISSTLKT